MMQQTNDRNQDLHVSDGELSVHCSTESDVQTMEMNQESSGHDVIGAISGLGRPLVFNDS